MDIEVILERHEQRIKTLERDMSDMKEVQIEIRSMNETLVTLDNEYYSYACFCGSVLLVPNFWQIFVHSFQIQTSPWLFFLRSTMTSYLYRIAQTAKQKADKNCPLFKKSLLITATKFAPNSIFHIKFLKNRIYLALI